ncbi:hypothetical protein M5689_011404 [Euphorbia peplus]|nr:hypothetical protein M5689_011404 [Euphorbia peplus]
MALGFPNSHTPCSDKLSTLPESIIFRIFTFLGPNETPRLSLVSTKFRQLCFNTPFLYLSADFDSSRNSFVRYSHFCNYVDSFMKSRIRLQIPIDCFVFRWFCKIPAINIGRQSLDTTLRFATACNLRELDILVNLGSDSRLYTLPVCVHQCSSLRVLRLNLPKSRFGLEFRKMGFVEVFFLESVCISDMGFGDKISRWWTSLRSLKLHNVSCDSDINLDISSLEELELSSSAFGRLLSNNWVFSVDSSSLKSFSIIWCKFKGRCLIDLDCPSLMNFSVYGSSFHLFSTLKIASEGLSSLVISSCYFEKSLCLYISCPSIKQMKIDGCKFEDCCHVRMNSLYLDVLTVSDCELIFPDEKSSEPGSQRRINVCAQRLLKLAINSSDKFSYKFPLCISAPNLQGITWKGNPVDFSYLKSLMAVENAIIDILPSCKHKSKRLACHCKLFMSLIYSVAMLLESLKGVKSLEINFWPIELFFMQNDEPVIFKNLLHLFLLVNDDVLADQLPVIASFLKGLPKLSTLIIKFEKQSALLGDPDLIDLLGLSPTDFTMSLGDDLKQLKICRGNAQFVGEELIQGCNLGRLTSVGKEKAA